MTGILHGEVRRDSKYSWATDKYTYERQNHWIPTEVPMARDIAQWNGGELSEAEVKMIKRNLGFFSTADSLAANNIALGTLRHIKVETIRQYLYRQASTEGIHTWAYQYIIESLKMDEGEVFNAYHEVETIKNKDEFALQYIDILSDPSFSVFTTKDVEKFATGVFVFAGVIEGLFFYPSFGQVLSLARRGLVPGSGTQFKYILRDESLHCTFGLDLFNTIRLEYPQIWTEEYKQSLVNIMTKSVQLEAEFTEESMDLGGILGMNVPSFIEYLKFIANRRLEQVGLPPQYSGVTNPYQWMSEMLDLTKEESFFEVRNTNYSTGVELDWD